MRAGREGMSVIVATAYMEEAEQFDWLVAMDAGRVLATGSPADIKAKTGSATLEESFIALLPEERRRGRKAFTIPPRPGGDGEPVIVAQGPDAPLRRLHGGRQRQFRDRARRDLRLSRLERLRQDDDDEDADGPVAGQRGRGAAVRQADRRFRHARAFSRRLYVAVLFALHRADGSPEPRPARASVPSRRGGRAAHRGARRALRACLLSRPARRRICRSAFASACRSPSPWCTGRKS